MLEVLLALNAIWFAMGFHAFYVRRKLFAKIVVPNKNHRDNSAYEAVVEAGRFMGGFNLALSVLNILLFFNIGGFDKDGQWATLLIFNAIAHGSQFAGNIPMAIQNRRGEGLWSVFKGIMLRIFVIDFTLMIFNMAMALPLIF
ncbi:MAG: hypothetical protein ABJQ90_18135 [Parasphingorhabdus sp.]